jgi:TolA-binding protein
MRPTSIEPLAPETERLFAQERKFLPEAADFRARAMNRARAALREQRSSFADSFFWRRSPLLVAAALVTLTAAAAFATWEARHRTSEVAPPPAAKTPVAAPLAPPPRAPAVEASPSEQSRAEPEAPGGTNPPAARRLSASDAYALELRLLQQARAAVASGRFQAALGAISEHERQFPAGRLGEEREALRVKALAGLGRHNEARSAAERFQKRFPDSVLSSSVEETARKNR